MDINNEDDVLVGSTVNPSKKQKTPVKATKESQRTLDQMTKESSDYIEVMGNSIFIANPFGLEPKDNQNNESKVEDRSIVHNKRKQDTSCASDYFKTKTPVNESRGEILEEFITPEVNTENVRNNHGMAKLYFTLGSNYFERLIEIPTELRESGDKSRVYIDETEPELPSDSYFIMIMPEHNKFLGDDVQNTTDVESSEISYSDSSSSK